MDYGEKRLHYVTWDKDYRIYIRGGMYTPEEAQIVRQELNRCLANWDFEQRAAKVYNDTFNNSST